MECLGGKGNVAVLSRRWAILVKHFFDEQVKNIEQIFQTKFFLKKAAKFEKKKEFLTRSCADRSCHRFHQLK